MNITNNTFYIPQSSCSFTIETDPFPLYLTLYDLKTLPEFQNQGFAKQLLNQIFEYTKSLNIPIITLICYKNNYKALNLYFSLGFTIYQEYEDSYCLIKSLS